jgi:hypothetical protein
MRSGDSGRARYRLPVSRNTAFATQGATSGKTASPIPFGGLSRLTNPPGNFKTAAAYAVYPLSGGGVAEWLKAAVC